MSSTQPLLTRAERVVSSVELLAWGKLLSLGVDALEVVNVANGRKIGNKDQDG